MVCVDSTIALVSRSLRVFFLGGWLSTTVLLLNVLQASSMLFLPFSGKYVIHFNSICAKTIWTCMQFVFEKLNGAKVTYSGDSLPKDENALIICNHVSFTDVYMIHGLAKRKGMLKACKYFAKDSLKWIPGFGWGIWLMNNIMIKRNWSTDKRILNEAFRGMKAYKLPTWLISYPEGTRRTLLKLQQSKAFAQDKGLPLFHHVLLPRTKGFTATVKSLLGSHIKAVYDLTLCYLHTPTKTLQAAPDMLRMHSHAFGDEYKFHIHSKRYNIEDLPDTEADLAQWLIERYQEKDNFLDRMNQAWLKDVELIDQ